MFFVKFDFFLLFAQKNIVKFSQFADCFYGIHMLYYRHRKGRYKPMAT